MAGYGRERRNKVLSLDNGYIYFREIPRQDLSHHLVIIDDERFHDLLPSSDFAFALSPLLAFVTSAANISIDTKVILSRSCRHHEVGLTDVINRAYVNRRPITEERNGLTHPAEYAVLLDPEGIFNVDRITREMALFGACA